MDWLDETTIVGDYEDLVVINGDSDLVSCGLLVNHLVSSVFPKSYFH